MSNSNKKEKRSLSNKSQAASDNRPKSTLSNDIEIPVVAVCASAGGIEAMKEFFSRLMPNCGFAVVIVFHRTSEHGSNLLEVIKSFSSVDVVEIEQGMVVEPNNVYVIPSDTDIAVSTETFHLFKPTVVNGVRFPIDFFLRSLATEKGEHAIAVILSGANADGTQGVKEIKAAGGLTIAQDPNSSIHGTMPQSAINSGYVDLVLPANRMVDEIVRYIDHPYSHGKDNRISPPNGELIEKVLILLRAKLGHDFTQYKQSTIWRRIQRRMALHHINEILAYIGFLERFPTEAEELFKELLIGVTNFFRDPQAFELLGSTIIPDLLSKKSPDTTVRVWVPACSTGEEAYSLAILFCEYMTRTNQRFSIQIFATDLDHESIEYARAGVYPENIATDVSPERLSRYFQHKGSFYHVSKQIREMIVFATQSLIKDPPFSRLDLISCRNLMIYLDANLQKKIISVFHYVLAKDGYLMLGSSETIGDQSTLFSITDRKWKIYQKKDMAVTTILDFPRLPLVKDEGGLVKTQNARNKDANLAEILIKLLFDSYVPPCVIINDDSEIVHFFGRTNKFLEPPIGEATLNILKMARDDLRLELRTAIHRALRDSVDVLEENVRLKSNGETMFINIRVRPLSELSAIQRYILVAFEEVVNMPAILNNLQEQTNSDLNFKTENLERELEHTKETLQTTIEELETSNEELKCTNEELQSSNEELQSANEELETSKEELQSINEELLTVNSELQSKLEELSLANNDLNNLLSSTETATIFLDNRLAIKRFTPTMNKLFHLISADIGRPISHISTTLVYEKMIEDIETVLRTLVFKESEVSTKQNERYFVRILPYRTADNRIDGVVITFVEITELNQARLRAEAALELSKAILNFADAPLLILNHDHHVIGVNNRFSKQYQLTREELLGRPIYHLDGKSWELPELKQLLEKQLKEKDLVENYRLDGKGLVVDAMRLSLPVQIMATKEITLLSCNVDGQEV